MEQRQERRRDSGQRRRRSRSRLMLAGMAAVGLLLAGAAGQALGSYLLVSVPNQPKGLMIWEYSPSPVPRDTTAHPTPTPSPTAEAPAAEDWQLTLVNPWNSLPDGFRVERTQLKNGQSVDSRCYPDLQEMMDDCRGAGLSPLICSSYRTRDKQESLFNRQVDKLMARGYDREAAVEEAATCVARPGTSEHELGLAVDIVDVNNQNLDKSQEETPAQKWLMEHCWEYGFILRYPSDKSEVTGIIYEPWHYRYVGREIALALRDRGLCLEEYLEQDL